MQTYTDQGRKLLTFIKYSLKQEQHLQHEATVLKPTVIPLDQNAVQRCAVLIRVYAAPKIQHKVANFL